MKFQYLIIDEDGTVTGSNEAQADIEGYVKANQGLVRVVDVEACEMIDFEDTGTDEDGSTERTEIEEADLEVEGEED